MRISAAWPILNIRLRLVELKRDVQSAVYNVRVAEGKVLEQLNFERATLWIIYSFTPAIGLGDT